MYNVLICDDEKDIVSALEIYLKGDGYNIFKAYDGQQAVDVVSNNEIHLVLMDIMMPLCDGITATAKLRDDYNMPIIFLSAKGEDSDKILGLNIGADDYVTKPFNPVEVLARVRSHLRRYTQLGSRVVENSCFTVGNIELNDRAKEVLVDGERVSLTPTEFEILKLLMKNKGKVLSPKEIYEKVWDEPCFGGESTVAVHIRHLREKVEINPAEPRYLKVVWAHGYKMEG